MVCWVVVLSAAPLWCVSGVFVSLTSVVLVDLLGIERLTNSFGLLLLFQGVATIVGPPVAGTYTRWRHATAGFILDVLCHVVEFNDYVQ